MAQFDKSKANPDLLETLFLLEINKRQRLNIQIWYIQTAPMRMVMLR